MNSINDSTDLASLDQVIYAKLRTTGEYALAGFSSGLGRDAAHQLLSQVSLGELPLSAGERSTAFLWGTALGTALLSVATPGPWPDHVGRPWTYRCLTVLPSAVVAAVEGDILLFADQLLGQRDFDETTEMSPVECRIPAADARRAESIRVLDAAVAHSGFLIGLRSILEEKPVLWILRDDAELLLRGCLLALPPSVRRRVTFATLAAALPKLPVRVVAARGPSPALVADGRVVLNLDNLSSPLDSENGRPASLAAAIVELLQRGDHDQLESWHDKAEQYVATLSPHESWPRIVSAVDDSIRFARPIVKETRDAGAEDFSVASRFRQAAGAGTRPPATLLWDEMMAAHPRGDLPSPEEVGAALAATIEQAGPNGSRIIPERLGRALANATAPSSAAVDWKPYLEAVSQFSDSPRVLLAGAIDALDEAQRLPDALAVFERLPVDERWSRAVAATLREAWSRQRRGAWTSPVDLFLAAYHFGAKSDLPSHEWLTDFTAQYQGPSSVSKPVRDAFSDVCKVAMRQDLDALDHLGLLTVHQDWQAAAIAATALLGFAARSTGTLRATDVAAVVRRGSPPEPPNASIRIAARQAALRMFAASTEVDARVARDSVPAAAVPEMWTTAICLMNETTHNGDPNRRTPWLGCVLAGVIQLRGTPDDAVARAVAAHVSLWIEKANPDDVGVEAVVKAGLADAMDGVCAGEFSARARGIALCWAFRTAVEAPTAHVWRRLHSWTNAIAARGVRLPAPTGTPLFKSKGTADARADAAATIASATEATLPAKEWDELAAYLMHHIGSDGRASWFARAVDAVGRQGRLLSALCEENASRGSTLPIPALDTLADAVKEGRLDAQLKKALSDMLPREGVMSMKKRGFS